MYPLIIHNDFIFFIFLNVFRQCVTAPYLYTYLHMYTLAFTTIHTHITNNILSYDQLYKPVLPNIYTHIYRNIYRLPSLRTSIKVWYCIVLSQILIELTMRYVSVLMARVQSKTNVLGYIKVQLQADQPTTPGPPLRWCGPLRFW